MGELTTIGLDIAKSVFQLHGIDAAGEVVPGGDLRLRRSGRDRARLRHHHPQIEGSEYPAVVIPLTTQHFPMLQRNLLYTAVTRGKRLGAHLLFAQHPRTLPLYLADEITSA